MVTPESDETV